MSSGSPYILDESSYANLKGKVIVISGGANGIGAALARRLVRTHAAHVYIGDVDIPAGEALAASLDRSSPSSSSSSPTTTTTAEEAGTATFLPTDASSYPSTLALFRAAHTARGRVDHAVACAGVLERGNWFRAANDGGPLGVGEVQEAGWEGDLGVVGVNLVGGLYFCRCAVGCLGEAAEGGGDGCLVVVSSAAAFRESPGLPVYQATKTALLGLVRNLALTVYPTQGIRVNAVLPAMTDTAMVGDAARVFRERGRAVNEADEVAAIMVDMLARRTREARPLNGLAVYVEGGRGWEIEEGLRRTMGEWLGEEPTARIEEDREAMEGGLWEKR